MGCLHDFAPHLHFSTKFSSNNLAWGFPGTKKICCLMTAGFELSKDLPTKLISKTTLMKNFQINPKLPIRNCAPCTRLGGLSLGLLLRFGRTPRRANGGRRAFTDHIETPHRKPGAAPAWVASC